MKERLCPQCGKWMPEDKWREHIDAVYGELARVVVAHAPAEWVR